MEISDELVATARAAFIRQWENVLLFDTAPLDRDMRAALEAVAPSIRAAAMEEAAKIAEGPEYQRDGKGDVYLRGAEDGNWYVPTTDFPNVGGYGQGRVDAAAAIRAAKETAR